MSHGTRKKSVGWKCAQRRPLRSLAHTLLLYDPDYVFLGDDDTYVNYPLLSMVTKRRINPDLYNKVISYGNLCKSFVTTRGLYFGGAGYLFGRRTLSSFTSHQILKDFKLVSRNRSLSLSLYQSALTYEKKHNVTIVYKASGVLDPFGNSQHDENVETVDDNSNDPRYFALLTNLTAQNLTSWLKGLQRAEALHAAVHQHPSNVANISMRAIDLCVLLLSGENTCHHSDHAVTRCLAYGIGAFLRGPKLLRDQKCDCLPYESDRAIFGEMNRENMTRDDTFFLNRVVPTFSSFYPQMCYGKFAYCDDRIDLTCHRRRPFSELKPIPVMIPRA